jgi:hypothetical protein
MSLLCLARYYNFNKRCTDDRRFIKNTAFALATYTGAFYFSIDRLATLKRQFNG